MSNDSVFYVVLDGSNVVVNSGHCPREIANLQAAPGQTVLITSDTGVVDDAIYSPEDIKSGFTITPGVGGSPATPSPPSDYGMKKPIDIPEVGRVINIVSDGLTVEIDSTDPKNPIVSANGALNAAKAYSDWSIAALLLGTMSKQNANSVAITGGTAAFSGPVSASNLSGTNTGDQTNIPGNAATATKLATARTIAGTSFDGSANINISYANLTGLPTLGTAAAKNVAASGNAASGEVVQGNDTRLSAWDPSTSKLTINTVVGTYSHFDFTGMAAGTKQVRFTGSAGGASIIAGMGTVPPSGAFIVVNDSNTNITFANQSASEGTATCRMEIGANYVLAPGHSMIMWYSTDLSRYRILGSN